MHSVQTFAFSLGLYQAIAIRFRILNIPSPSLFPPDSTRIKFSFPLLFSLFFSISFFFQTLYRLQRNPLITSGLFLSPSSLDLNWKTSLSPTFFISRICAAIKCFSFFQIIGFEMSQRGLLVRAKSAGKSFVIASLAQKAEIKVAFLMAKLFDAFLKSWQGVQQKPCWL